MSFKKSWFRPAVANLQHMEQQIREGSGNTGIDRAGGRKQNNNLGKGRRLDGVQGGCGPYFVAHLSKGWPPLV